MAVFQKEMKQGGRALCIWTAAVSLMLAVCIFIFPEMKMQMESVTRLFANMGSFTKAFGMDQLNFGELIGFYGVECGNVLGICGGFYAAFLGVSSLSKEEKEHTAEFLMSHPVGRCSVILQKLLSVVVSLLAMNAVIFLVSMLSIRLIGEALPVRELLLIHGAYLLLQLEIAFICFGMSAFLRRGSITAGLGLAAVLYFMDLICNLSEQGKFLKYITPFSYAKPAEIVSHLSLDGVLAALGILYGALGVLAAFVKYTRKDLAA